VGIGGPQGRRILLTLKANASESQYMFLAGLARSIFTLIFIAGLVQRFLVHCRVRASTFVNRQVCLFSPHNFFVTFWQNTFI